MHSKCVYVIFIKVIADVSILGGMGAAANAASKFHCQLQSVVPFYITMGGFLSGVGCLLFILVILKTVSGSLHKYLRYTFVFILTVLIMSLFVSIVAVPVLSITAAASMFPITQAEYCSHVIYYWAFVEVLIILSTFGLFTVVFLLYWTVVSCYCLLAWLN